MTRIKLSVTMLLVGCGLFFSGCPAKTVYLKCKAEEPTRSYDKNCGHENNVTKFSKCVIEKQLWLEHDYDVLMTRFRSCK